MNHYSLVSCDKALKMDDGISILKKGANMTGRTPMARQIKCSSVVSGTVLSDYPPNSTQMYWTTMVNIIIMKKRGLLKKLAKTFSYDDFSLRAFISLKTCIKTNELKNIQ